MITFLVIKELSFIGFMFIMTLFTSIWEINNINYFKVSVNVSCYSSISLIRHILRVSWKIADKTLFNPLPILQDVITQSNYPILQAINNQCTTTIRIYIKRFWEIKYSNYFNYISLPGINKEQIIKCVIINTQPIRDCLVSIEIIVKLTTTRTCMCSC